MKSRGVYQDMNIGSILCNHKRESRKLALRRSVKYWGSTCSLLFAFTMARCQSLSVLAELDAGLQEASGMVTINDKLIAHNDSGGEPALYEINQTDGTIDRTVYVENVANMDWEDICADENYIYIGDIGNNAGDRADLKIYRILISAYTNAANDTVQAETINFSYADQTSFEPAPLATNFDAEALVVIDDSLWVFTKNWIDMQSNIYCVSKEPGTHIANVRGSITANGLITGGTFNSASNTLTLSGHNLVLQPFILILEDFEPGPLAEESIQRLDLEIPIGVSRQIEAIDLVGIQYLILSEAGFTGNGALMSFSPLHLNTSSPDHLNQLLYPNPASDFVAIPLRSGEYANVYSMAGKLLLSTNQGRISTESLPAGNYIFEICGITGKPLRAQMVFIVK